MEVRYRGEAIVEKDGLTAADYRGLESMVDTIAPSMRVPRHAAVEGDEEIAKAKTKTAAGLINDP